MIGIKKLFDFQEECSQFLFDYCNSTTNKKTLIVKAPTGAGKTIILLNFMDKYLAMKSRKICFIWLTPGSGELEEQSRKKMDAHLPHYTSKTIDDVLTGGFDDKDICFINWERVTKKGNKAIAEAERKNLFERIADAHRSQMDFIVLIDEEHQHNTSKAKDVIDSFAPLYQIRVSATSQESKIFDHYEIAEERVINSGLITRALYINEDVTESNISDEHGMLLELANEKRKIIKQEYQKIEKNINPLVIVQFPNESPELIQLIEDKLKKMNITYDNGLLAIWMSGKDYKKNLDNLETIDGTVQFLLIKQAIATGWDCPRAKILVKLRENMNEQFEIQTIGRLRRMPEAKHYDNNILDNAYLYTFDEKYTESVKQNVHSAYLVRRIFLKSEHRDFSLVKQIRNLDYAGAGDRETRDRLYNFFMEKYNLKNDYELNLTLLSTYGYNSSNQIEKTIVKDKVIKTIDMVSENLNKHYVAHDVNTHENGIELRQTIDSFKNFLNMSYEKTRAVFELLFRDNRISRQKILKLNTSDFYAFIINNGHKIKEDLRELSSGTTYQQTLVLESKTDIFKFPEQDVLKYINDSDVEDFSKNVYHDYKDDCLVEGLRSKSERLFERFCQNNDAIEWFYKNGDTGQNYFSVVYLDGNQKQHLFYADYIIKTKNGEVWVIETKGGEGANGQDKNIDRNVLNKFNAFKHYSEIHNIKWGFVRDKNEKLYLNNTEYIDDMNDDSWININNIF